MSVSMSEEAVGAAASTLGDVAGRVGLDLRWWVPDCGDAAASGALTEWVACVALETAAGAERVRGLGQDAVTAAGVLDAMDADVAARTRVGATSGVVRAV
jgi:hypothetical protein